MLDQGSGREASPSWGRRQFVADTRARKLKDWDDNKQVLVKI